MKKKILFLTARLPFPANSGRKNVMYNYCKILNEEFGYDIINVSFLENQDDISKKPNFIKEVIVLPKISSKRKLINIIKNTLIFKKKPMQVSLYYDKKVKQLLDEIVTEHSPDILIADMVRTTEYLKDYPIFKIADLDDMLSIRYDRQLKIGLENINPYGAYLYSFPKFLQVILEKNFLKEFILKNEIELLKKYEKLMAEIYDKTVFVAENEAQKMNKITGGKKSIAVPLGVDFEFFSEEIPVKKEKNVIGFLGAMNVAHNEYGVIHFIEKVFPLILKEIPNAKFMIIGGGVTNKIKKLETDNIIVTGRVDDVRQYVKKCEIFVCPLTFGSGIKTKNLEAMAMKVPVVTTSIGAENIPAKDRVDWIVVNTEEEMAREVIQLLNDEYLQNKIAFNGQNYVKNNFTWKVASKKFDELFEQLQI